MTMTIHTGFAWLAWWLLVVIMLMRPLGQVVQSRAILSRLAWRKWLGIACGVAAFVHAGLYLLTHQMVVQYMTDPFYWTPTHFFGWGSVALVLLFIPFVTSSHAAHRLLARRWKTVQRFAYPAFIAAGIHVAMATHTLVPYVCLVVWAVVYVVAFVRKRKSIYVEMPG